MEDISFSTKSMFWGVVLKPEKRYEQNVEEPFHISKACLEPSSIKDSKNAVTSVYIEVDDEEFLLCNLTDKVLNESLDLNFNVGDKIVFKTSGAGVVHLTGYNVFEDDGPDSDDDGEFDEEESTDESVDEAPQLVNGKKRKMNESISDVPTKKKDTKQSPLDKILADQKKEASKVDKKAEIKKASEIQKKIAQAMAKRADEEDDSDDDSEGEEEESDDDEGDDSNLVDDEAEDESGEEEEEDEDDEGEEEEEDMETDVSPKKEMNGSPKKQMNGNAKKEAKSPEKSPKADTTPEGEKKKKKKKNKKNKNKENKENSESSGDAKTPVKKEQPKGKDEKKTPAKDQQEKPKTPGKTPKRTLKGGIQVEDLKEGNGPMAKRGKMLGMYYEGKLQKNGKTFDKCLGGKPFKFRLGQGEVIKGWDVGLEGIKVGGKRRLTIPAPLAYGQQGAGSDIPPNATLVFEVECKAVQ